MFNAVYHPANRFVIGQVTVGQRWFNHFQLYTTHTTWFYERGNGLALRVNRGSKFLLHVRFFSGGWPVRFGRPKV